MEIIDSSKQHEQKKHLWTIWLLITSLGLIAVTFLIATFWEAFGLTEEETIWLAVSIMIGTAANIGGLVAGIVELKKNRLRAMVGIIGNAVMILLVFGLIGYSLVSPV